MELLQLRYFCEVARRESVTKVAEELHVSQPSLSKTIKNLDQELGVVLFDRVKKRIVLNEQGKEFYDKVSKGLNLIDSAVDGLSVTPDSENGTISLIVKAGQCFFPPMYDLFCKLHPNIILDVANFSLMQRKLMTEYDFHISASMNTYENVEFEYLMREEIVIVLNRSHPLAKKKLLHMSELREEPFIAGWRGSSSNTLMVSLCHAAGFVPKFCAYYSEMERIFRAISENEGISIIPYDSLKDTLKEHEDLTYAFIADPGNYRLLKLCWPKKNFESRRNQMFREYALNYFADLEKRLMEEKQCVFHNNCITHKEYILEYF